ncbi:MAG: SCO family protein [Rhodothermaceae bacterium]|nr:SCO family protein [Rhodothermaceae bacterium]MYD67963.1 SCO family protein [Rhodothermaceae bacterium]MYH11257.1 SCO family protein [Rhodothermaceae bacterium]
MHKGCIAILTLCMYSAPVYAQLTEQASLAYEGVGLTPRLGEQIPLDLVFTDSYGKAVTLGEYFQQDRPVVLTFVYHTCPMLCSVLLDGVTRSLDDVPWAPGDGYEMVTVSFSPADTPERAAEQRARYLRRLDDEDAEWHFLTGSEDAIRALTQATGFMFKWVEEQGEYAHPAAVIVLSDEGIITRYLPDLAPRGRDLRAAIVEASDGTVGNLLDRAFLYCFQFDPTANSYVLVARRAMQVGGGITALILIVSLGLLWMKDTKKSEYA